MKTIITGGAGFIGCNAAARFLRKGHRVVIIDDLSRKGTARNLDWLRRQGCLEFHKCDIRDAFAVEDIVNAHADVDLLLHLAGQVAVTNSVSDPLEDFEINAIGSFNVLEAARKARLSCPIIYSSTNKVYGGLEGVQVREEPQRYSLHGLPYGVSERQPLDFHSPYGCSKGSAEQYFRDYHRIFGLKTVVFRQSCIYGCRQFGIEDQGWVAWFTIAAELGKPITIYGDGKQVRDVLFVEDLVDAFEAAARHIDAIAGRVFNIGGGPENALSLLQFVDFLRNTYRSLKCSFSDWRPGDQRIYVSDVRQAERELEWRPQTSIAAGLSKLQTWVTVNKELFQ